MKNKSSLQLAGKPATIDIDGKIYELAWDFDEICNAETVTGLNLLHGLGRLYQMTSGQLRGLLLAALKPKSPKITLDDVTEMVRLDRIAPLTDALAKCYMLSLPELPDAEAPPAAS